LQLLQPSIEPAPATDGLIHLAYEGQMTNTGERRADIVSVVPVDPLADFSPTGRNLITDSQGRDVAGKVKLLSGHRMTSCRTTASNRRQNRRRASRRVYRAGTRD
jgi:hypothetical protein